MANFVEGNADYSVTIPSYERNDVTYYKVVIQVEEVTWYVNHRYKDFLNLHSTLVSDHSIAKDILPPKKVFGANNPEFIEKRRIGLEIYLKAVVNFLRKAAPPALLHFLEFNKYDALCIVQDFALFCFEQGDRYLQKHSDYTFNPLQLYSISKRLQTECPPTETYNTEYNVSHILDFCSQLATIIIRGGNQNIGTSNLVHNKLTYDLSIFKNASTVKFYNVKLENICNVDSLRRNVVSVIVCNSGVKSITEALLCDKVHKYFENVDSTILWSKLRNLDLSWNEIKCIDNGIKLCPRLETLSLDGNQLTSLDITEPLPELKHLSASANNISLSEPLEVKLPGIVQLQMSRNYVTTLRPFAKLTHLKVLELASNGISDIEEVKYICKLPHLTALVLTGNPVASVIRYRVKVFEYFEDRAEYLDLDNERPSQQELSTAAVLKALTISREGKQPFSQLVY